MVKPTPAVVEPVYAEIPFDVIRVTYASLRVFQPEAAAIVDDHSSVPFFVSVSFQIFTYPGAKPKETLIAEPVPVTVPVIGKDDII